MSNQESNQIMRQPTSNERAKEGTGGSLSMLFTEMPEIYYYKKIQIMWNVILLSDIY